METFHRDDEIPGNVVRKVVLDPEIRRGTPTLSGTRIAIHEITGMARVNGIDAVFGVWPHLSREDVEVALKYAKEHPQAGEDH